MPLSNLCLELMSGGVYPMEVKDLMARVERDGDLSRSKRSTGVDPGDPTYIDAIGVPRGVPDKYKLLHSKMTNRRVVLLIVCIWAGAIIMGLVPSIGWNCECQCQRLCAEINCSIIAPLYSHRYMIFWASLNLLTFSVMVAVYARIYVYVRRQGKRMSQHTSHHLRHNETVVNLMKTISIVLGVFVICWTPGLMTLLLDGIMGKDSHAMTYEKYCLTLAECNSLVNPIIYSFLDEEMRRTFKCILCCLCRRSSDHQGEQSPVEFNTLQPECVLT
ncbi:lysophosphatidic acid receptor 1-A-like [Salvelinus fontinalis]|uniref:lysophosphatidic acid receptor 1-A-like n=1 Tax=Salvelinus fontinalis TaxID=8038 RepID=UPI0024856882|nr:lysophosphatidic acid receptor 1-A-like [Salvelinus fontinalis]